MKLKYTGQAQAPVTFLGKFTVEPGDEVEADDAEANTLLQTGSFAVVDGDGGTEPAPKASETKKSSDSKDSSK